MHTLGAWQRLLRRTTHDCRNPGREKAIEYRVSRDFSPPSSTLPEGEARRKPACPESPIRADRLPSRCPFTGTVVMRLAENRKASHDYFIEERYEAGLALEGWEVKAIRAGRAQLGEAYVVLRSGEVYLIGSHISPLTSASTHVHADPTRTRKLLLKAAEIDKLIGRVERAGYTLVPLDLHLTRGRIKLAVGLAKGKKQHDKRAAEKDREWQRERQRLLRA
jgi:SsrA-binding protein